MKQSLRNHTITRLNVTFFRTALQGKKGKERQGKKLKTISMYPGRLGRQSRESSLVPDSCTGSRTNVSDCSPRCIKGA